MREYTNGEKIIANIPYVAMIVMGASTIAFGFGLTAFRHLGRAELRGLRCCRRRVDYDFLVPVLCILRDPKMSVRIWDNIAEVREKG